MKYYFYKKEVKKFHNFTLNLQNKAVPFLALTSNPVSFTFSLLLHHWYNHTTLSYSHLLSALFWYRPTSTVCSVFVLTFGILPSLQLFLDSASELTGDSFPDGTCL